MEAHIQKLGEGLAIYIPSSFAESAGLSENTVVDLSLQEGKVIVQPRVRKKKVRLEDLLSGITPENIHKEVDMGPPVGKEIW